MKTKADLGSACTICSFLAKTLPLIVEYLIPEAFENITKGRLHLEMKKIINAFRLPTCNPVCKTLRNPQIEALAGDLTLDE